MCKYLLNLIEFNVDKPEDYYDSKMELSISSLFHILLAINEHILKKAQFLSSCVWPNCYSAVQNFFVSFYCEWWNGNSVRHKL